MLHLDGKEFTPPRQGTAAVADAEKSVASRIDTHTIETVFKRGGKAVASVITSKPAINYHPKTGH
jgi:hypothetical protein